MRTVMTAFSIILWGLGVCWAQQVPDSLAPPSADQSTELTPSAEANIPIQFHIESAGYVTIVIEDSEGKRIRNLISDTFYEAGEHTVYWDGYDVGDKKGKKEHFDVHRHLVSPGSYRVKGLIHDDIELKYEYAVQSPGDPPWYTTDRSGGWLADHTPPQTALFVPGGSPFGQNPQIILTATVAEAGHCIMWLTEDGEKLYGGKFAGWRGPSALARDKGPNPDKRFYACAMVYDRGHLALYGLPVESENYTSARFYHRETKMPRKQPDRRGELAKMGLVVWNGVAAYTPPQMNVIEFYDISANKVLGTAAMEDARGMALDRKGRLFVISGTSILRFDAPQFKKATTGKGRVIVENLADPRKLRIGPRGQLYVSDWGKSHQVKMFSGDGEHICTIGKAGGQQFGRYNEEQMCRPGGMAVDGDGKLWVAEVSYAPKRISVWDTKTGAFLRAYYGPPRYGGGGQVDPRDANRFYYPSGGQGIEFRRDAETDRFTPHSIYWHRKHSMGRCPGTPVHKNGRQYMVSTFIGPAYFLAQDAQVYFYNEETSTVQCIAWVGACSRKGIKGRFLGKYTDKNRDLKKKLEKGWGEGHWKSRFAVWSDLNLDGEPQADEVQAVNFGRKGVRRSQCGVSFTRDLAIATTSGVHVPAPTFTDRGVPVWDLAEWEPLAYHNEHLSDVVLTPDRYFVYTMGGYSQQRVMRGYRDGELMWKFNGMRRAVARHKGQLVNAQRHIGFPFKPVAGEAGWLFALNGYHGSVYLMTGDGQYVTDLGADHRTHPTMGPANARKGMVIDDLSFGAEHFWPATVQMEDGTIYLVAGDRCENLIFEVVGLDTVRRLDSWDISVSPAQLEGKQKKIVLPGEGRRQTRRIKVVIRKKPPELDGQLDDWPGAAMVTIDERRKIRGAMTVHGKTLYAAWETEDPELLNNNAPDGWQYVFATDGGLDLMFRVKDDSELKRAGRVAEGDKRLFVTRRGDPQKSPVLAVLFQQEGGKGEGVTYDSPVGEVKFDTVRDVSDRVRLAQSGGNYELSVPLSMLGLEVSHQKKVRGDIGVLIGDGSQVRARLYWNNRSATMVSDIPTEARLTPGRWGKLEFEKKTTGVKVPEKLLDP